MKKNTQVHRDDGDVEVPPEGGLKIKRRDDTNFPGALRRVSGQGSVQSSPARQMQTIQKFDSSPRPHLRPRPAKANLLDRFHDDDDNNFFGDEGVTIKLAKNREVPKLQPFVISPTPLATITNQLKAKVSATTGLNVIHAHPVMPSKHKGLPHKPQLIKPLGNLNDPKSINGMYHNPYTFRREGKENDIASFGDRASPPSNAPFPSHMQREKDTTALYRERENATPHPSLMQYLDSSMDVQVVGRMVFNRQKMCWLKMSASLASQKRGQSEAGDIIDGFDSFEDDEDVFKHIPDLEDNENKNVEAAGCRRSDCATTSKDERLDGKELDVGRESEKRQREEDVWWRSKGER